MRIPVDLVTNGGEETESRRIEACIGRLCLSWCSGGIVDCESEGAGSIPALRPLSYKCFLIMDV